MPKHNFTPDSGADRDLTAAERTRRVSGGEPWIHPTGVLGTMYGPGAIVDVGCDTCAPVLHVIPNEGDGPMNVYLVRQHEPTCATRAALRDGGTK